MHDCLIQPHPRLLTLPAPVVPAPSEPVTKLFAGLQTPCTFLDKSINNLVSNDVSNHQYVLLSEDKMGSYSSNDEDYEDSAINFSVSTLPNDLRQWALEEHISHT